MKLKNESENEGEVENESETENENERTLPVALMVSYQHTFRPLQPVFFLKILLTKREKSFHAVIKINSIVSFVVCFFKKTFINFIIYSSTSG